MEGICFRINEAEGFAKRPLDALLAKQNLDPFPRISKADSEKDDSRNISKFPSASEDCSACRGKLSKVIINNIEYSVEKMAAIHPGGDLFVKAFAGRDATTAFMSYHRRSFPHHKYVDLVLLPYDGIIKPTEDNEYLELCKLIAKVLPLNKSFAPSSYFVKVFLFVCLTVGLETYIHCSKSYVWYLTGPLGLLFAWIGLNVQHDANHGAISPHFYVNRTFGLMQNWIGGSCIVWIHQHVVQHHIYCNDVDRDPDMKGNQVLKLNPQATNEKHFMYQHIYFLGIFALFGFTVVKDSIVSIINGFYFTPMSPFLNNYRKVDIFCSMLFAVRWIFLPIYQVPAASTLANVAVLYIVSGYYLSFFFLLSHNFAGTQHNKGDIDNSHFLRQQVLSSSNVGGPWLCWLNGGLNYQIEHHLFPRIHHSHYPKIAFIVREFCRERDISYRHFTSIRENLLSTSAHLYDISR
jgi:fatty acid desaturase (delta-4 desaturase)